MFEITKGIPSNLDDNAEDMRAGRSASKEKREKKVRETMASEEVKFIKSFLASIMRKLHCNPCEGYDDILSVTDIESWKREARLFIEHKMR